MPTPPFCCQIGEGQRGQYTTVRHCSERNLPARKTLVCKSALDGTGRCPGGAAGFRGGGHGTGNAAQRDISPTAPRFPPPVARSSTQAAKLYSYSPERRTAPRQGLSARAGTPKERFCNTTHAGVSGHDNAHGFYDAITRGKFAPFIWNVIRLLPKAHS